MPYVAKTFVEGADLQNSRASKHEYSLKQKPTLRDFNGAAPAGVGG